MADKAVRAEALVLNCQLLVPMQWSFARRRALPRPSTPDPSG